MSGVTYEKHGRIAYVTLNRPEALNALDDELNADLRQCWSDFNDDPGADIAIVTGTGRAFCAGADVRTFLPDWERANMFDVRRNVLSGIGGGLRATHCGLRFNAI